jgi:hypothetical protein
MENSVTTFMDLTWYAVIFAAAAAIFFAAHVIAAHFRIVSGATSRVVALAVFAAVATGLLSGLLFGSCFSSPEVHALASITAPICFLGFCGVYMLIGPVTVDRSITLTILEALLAVQDQELAEDRLMGAVPFERIFGKRLIELESGGFIRRHRGSIKVCASGERMLRAYLRMGRLLNIELQKN